MAQRDMSIFAALRGGAPIKHRREEFVSHMVLRRNDAVTRVVPTKS